MQPGCNSGLSTRWVIADLHFGDARLCGSDARPFSSATEMDAELARRWNEAVAPADTVFVLGDLGRRFDMDAVRGLNGRKHLVAGNGDDLTTMTRAGVFETITVARWERGFLLTHIPVHPSQLRGWTINVHGHLHGAVVDDPRYRCVSVEQTDYRPVRLESLGQRSAQGSLF